MPTGVFVVFINCCIYDNREVIMFERIEFLFKSYVGAHETRDMYWARLNEKQLDPVLVDMARRRFVAWLKEQ